MAKKVLFEGPDISVYQGNVDMKRVRDAGCKRIALRAGYGKNNIDEKYVVNAQACYNLNVDTMIYWFSYAYTEEMARKEAEYAIAAAAKYWKKCPIAFDGEYDTVRYARTKGVNIDKNLMTNMAIAFLTKVEEQGYIPVLYTNNDYLKNYFDIDKIANALKTVYIWYARYNLNALPASEENIPDIWQYTSKGKLDGVTGNVDLNKYYNNFTKNTPVKNAGTSKTCNINILNFQKAANADGYKDYTNKKLVEDGIDGSHTQSVRAKINMQAKKVGDRYKAGSTGEVVKWWQTRCNEILGTNLEIDGRFGPATRRATITLQKKFGLKVDGIAGKNSIQSVFYN